MAELAHHFLFRFNRELNLDLRGIDPEALALLLQHLWPGNVRELQSVIKEAMLRGTGHLLLPEFLPAGLQVEPREPAPPSVGNGSVDLAAVIEDLLRRGEKDLHARVIQVVERLLLTRVLKHTHGHQTQASELLGLNRSTLRAKLRELGVSLDKVPVVEPPETV